jgi:hypothetical protein
MKIKIKEMYQDEGVEYLAPFCDVDSYEDGVVEAARETADNVAKILGRLVEVLVEKKILTPVDITKLTGEKNLTKITLMEDQHYAQRRISRKK